tara:strand:- start:120 stop:296 length:177 start_codon:yes stop_codon:yes gene_type:complete
LIIIPALGLPLLSTIAGFVNEDAKIYVISGCAKSIVFIWIFKDKKILLEVVKLGATKV